jgi:uridine kinase
MRILSSSFWNIICQVNASDVIILEGILVFHDQRVRNLMNMKIFVDTGLSLT